MTPAPDWLSAPPAAIDRASEGLARARQDQLIKPPGALGRLEDLAIRLAGLQRTVLPAVDCVSICLFAGDHGVAAEGISAFPQSVTVAMLGSFAGGLSAVSVLAREQGASLELINLGTATPVDVPGVLNLDLGRGTANFTCAPAMTEEQLERALKAGREAAQRAHGGGMQLFIGGEMGIGNTTAATALAAALLDEAPDALAGPGTGLNAQGVAHKREVIRRALSLHQAYLHQPREALRRLGGFEIAALAGAFIACAQMGLPVLVDGFICTASALAAERLCPGTRDWLLFAHRSGEPGHARLLRALGAEPLLDLGLRLGEGSGAAVAMPLLRLACSLHRDMATFEEAGVANQSP